jgi:hypothetical protein
MTIFKVKKRWGVKNGTMALLKGKLKAINGNWHIVYDNGLEINLWHKAYGNNGFRRKELSLVEV